MKEFSKKYNYKNIKKTEKINKVWDIVSSCLFPSDQKMHPWCIFSLFWQDLFSKISELNWVQNNLGLWFGLSSGFYSKLNKDNLNLKQLEIDTIKQTKQNKKFLDKIWFSQYFNENSFVCSENFNRYVRKVFVDLYTSWKIFSQKEVVYRSKIFQTNLFKNNIKSENIEVYEYSIKYFIEAKWVNFVVPTTRIETIFADVALAVNPQDKRYKKLIWQNVIIPIINKNIPIIWDETVDPFCWTWVMRITPWHDEYWLQIAKKHNLLIDIFAVDTNWNFTKHAWEFWEKPVIEFLGNIIKYIEDIWNLESKKLILQERFFDLKSNESLDNITLDQRNVKYSYSLDFLSENIKSDNIKIYPSSQKDSLLEILEQKESINISNKSAKWISIPMLKSSGLENFPINDDKLLDKYIDSNSKKDITFTLILLNLILDNQISCKFTLEQLIDTLFFTSFSGEETKLEAYINIYENEKKQEYKKWLKNIKKLFSIIDKDNEKIRLIIELLENSFAISSDWEYYYLDFSNIFNTKNKLFLQENDSFNKNFIDSVWFLYKNNFTHSADSYDKVKFFWWSFLSSLDNNDFPLNTLLLVLEYSRNVIFSDIIFHPNLVETKWNRITNYNSKFLTKELIETFDVYWPDIMRLLLLLWERIDNNIIFDTYKAQDWNAVLNKIWNANRYVYNKYIKSWKKIKIQNLLKNLEKDTTDYDGWILHWIKSLIDDFEYQTWENKILDFWNRIFDFIINNLCDKYLESTKIYSQENTSNVIVFSFVIILKILEPYVPFFVSEIESNFNIDFEGYSLLDFKKFELKEKNYKINIFMDIIDKLKILRTKIWSNKHENIDVFIQANPEFISFLSENEELFRKLISVSHIDYIRLHEDSPQWYEVDNVINISIWAKAVLEQKEIGKDVLLEMKQELDNKLEHLQHLKSLISSIVHLVDAEIIKQKRKDVDRLQNEIDELEFNITKLKVK